MWLKDRFVPYPFQNNIHRLPSEDIVNCLDGVVKAKEASRSYTAPPKTFQDWINRNFGDGISDIFLNPYNYKVWAFKPEQMNAQWMGERVPTVDIKRIVKNIVNNEDDVGWGPNATFRFPMHGGTGGIWTAIADALPRDQIRLNTSVTSVDVEKKTVTTNSGEVVPYDVLISTMPLTLLLEMTTGAGSAPLKEHKDTGVYSTSHILGLGLKGQPPAHLKGKCWMYFPEDDCPFYRVTLFSHYSPKNVPDVNNQWSLMFEVSESTAKPVPADVLEATIQGALNTKLISSRDEIISTWHERLEYGYPTPFIGRDEWLAKVQPQLLKLDIWSRGRFGGWKYEVGNQDHSLMQGVEAADSALFGIEETTYFYADLVNSRTNTQRSYKKL